jgi:hypothetical protein
MIFLAKNEQTFIFTASLLANNGRSFQLNIVLIYDKQMFDALVNLSNNDFFKNKSLLERENPGVLEIFNVEILPGKTYAPQTIPISSKKQLIGSIIFVDFSMVKGQINRKLIAGSDFNEFPIYFDENGIQIYKTL